MNTEFFNTIRAGMVNSIPLMGTEFEFLDILTGDQPTRLRGVADRHSRGHDLHDGGMGMGLMDGGSIVFAASDFPAGVDFNRLSGSRIKDLRDGVIRRVGEDVTVDGLAVEIHLVRL